jgi:REP element-mobilizing transposase RayT
MTRLRRIATRDRYFFITTILARNCAPLNSEERDVVLQVIAEHRERGAFWLYGYCVMSTHLHLLLRPNNQDLAVALSGIKGVANSRIIHARKTRASIWQPKYFDNIIRRVGDFWAKLEYIHNNPVAQGWSRVRGIGNGRRMLHLRTVARCRFQSMWPICPRIPIHCCGESEVEFVAQGASSALGIFLA